MKGTSSLVIVADACTSQTPDWIRSLAAALDLKLIANRQVKERLAKVLDPMDFLLNPDGRARLVYVMQQLFAEAIHDSNGRLLLEGISWLAGLPGKVDWVFFDVGAILRGPSVRGQPAQQRAKRAREYVLSQARELDRNRVQELPADLDDDHKVAIVRRSFG